MGGRLLLGTILTFLLLIGAASADVRVDRWEREGWKTDFSKSMIDFAEILSGGPPRDGIPSIDDPKFIAVAQEKQVEGREPVIVLVVGTEVRAYPLRILTWHEIANDVVAGIPVAVTYCPLCNAAIVFDRRIDGQTLEFGTTGKLRNSDLVMYDRQTDSWWQQFTGRAIVGSFIGTKLKMLPSRIMSFAAYKAEYPEGVVLVPSNPRLRDYGRNPYAGYDSASAPFLYSGAMPEGIAAMARVVVVRTDSEPIIVSLERVRQNGYSAKGYDIAWVAGVASALDTSEISKGRDVGTVRVTRSGKDIAHDVTFAFVAHAFHPDIEIIGK